MKIFKKRALPTVTHCGDGRALISLPKGRFAIVDDDDAEWVMRWRWQVIGRSDRLYVVRSTSTANGALKKMVYLHRELLGAIAGVMIDHVDHDGLNNTRANLRIATQSQNNHNARKSQKPRTSIFKGVSWSKQKRTWISFISVAGRYVHLGSFRDEKLAAAAYDSAASRAFGEFSCTNARLGLMEKS